MPGNAKRCMFICRGSVLTDPSSQITKHQVAVNMIFDTQMQTMSEKSNFPLFCGYIYIKLVPRYQIKPHRVIYTMNIFFSVFNPLIQVVQTCDMFVGLQLKQFIHLIQNFSYWLFWCVNLILHISRPEYAGLRNSEISCYETFLSDQCSNLGQSSA
jgi:hypothetical protein